jgi:hypothetical protein
VRLSMSSSAESVRDYGRISQLHFIFSHHHYSQSILFCLSTTLLLSIYPDIGPKSPSPRGLVTTRDCQTSCLSANTRILSTSFVLFSRLLLLIKISALPSSQPLYTPHPPLFRLWNPASLLKAFHPLNSLSFNSNSLLFDLEYQFFTFSRVFSHRSISSTNPSIHQTRQMHPSSMESSNPLGFPFVFDPFDSRFPPYDTPSPPCTIDGVTIHSHVDTFVESINWAIDVYGSVFVKDNLHHCLRGNALKWYSALLKIDKESIHEDCSLSLPQWIGRLQVQFHSQRPLCQRLW